MNPLLRPIFAGALAWASTFLAIAFLHGKLRNPEDAVALLIVALFTVVPLLFIPGILLTSKLARFGTTGAPRGAMLARGFAYGLILGAVPALPGLVAQVALPPSSLGLLISLPFLIGGLTQGLLTAWLLSEPAA